MLAFVFKTWAEDHKEWLFALGGLSLLTLATSALVLPVIVTRMRADYFLPDRDHTRSLAHQHPVIRGIGIVLKNLFGTILFLAGILMLGLPGQGILTILIGLMLLDFPGKQKLELWMVRLPAVGKALNWMRKRGDRPPLEIPPRTVAGKSLESPVQK